VRRFFSTIVLSSLLVIPATAAETVDAVWLEQKVDFAFLGLDVAYSCDAIKASLEMLLRHVGAADVEVIVPSCGGFKGAHSHHRITARFSTLVPAADGAVDIAGCVEQVGWQGIHGRSTMATASCSSTFRNTSCQRSNTRRLKARLGAQPDDPSGQLKLKVLKPVQRDGAAESDAHRRSG
jgi:hypothetical protein